MMSADFDPLAFLVRFASTPTAPFREHRVQAEVAAFARRFRSLKLARDAHGNLLLLRPGRRPRLTPRLIFVAHLDHPGFVVRQRLDARTVDCDFHGGVMSRYVEGARVRFFPEARDEIVGRAITAVDDERGRCRTTSVRVRGELPPGTFGMFDLVPGRLAGKRFHGRACDDLAGAAAALCLLADLARKPADADVGVLLTRGEEAGFVGALASVIGPRSLLRSTDRVISIECSAEQPVARQGDGVVLRVGDATSVFDSAFGRFLLDASVALAKDDSSFRYQRALMPGGTCEGTVFDAWGHTTAALCVPLGNYHNMDQTRGRLAAEHVHLEDWRSMLKLFARVARTIQTFDGTHGALRAKLSATFQTKRALLNPQSV